MEKAKPMNNPLYLTAKEAALELDISLSTLYSYVSRGLVRSEELDRGWRTRRYHAEDVRKLKLGREHRKNPKKAIRGTMHFGTPVLDSALTLIADNKLYYRGYNARDLAENHSLEQVAWLIWSGRLSKGEVPLFGRNKPLNLVEPLLGTLAPLEPITRIQVVLPLIAAAEEAGELKPKHLLRRAGHILNLMVSLAAGTEDFEPTLARRLQRGWLPEQEEAADLLEKAMIVCADHELNVSSFTARCVASAHASLYQVVLAGLSALQGALHGREGLRFARFLNHVGGRRDLRAAIGQWRKRETIPGFGHTLYPSGDPRVAYLLDCIEKRYPAAPVLAKVQEICAVVAAETGARPTVDVGLATLVTVLGLPAGNGLCLFALGRAVGWLGHGMETYRNDPLIRPRANYTGKPPRPLP